MDVTRTHSKHLTLTETWHHEWQALYLPEQGNRIEAGVVREAKIGFLDIQSMDWRVNGRALTVGEEKRDYSRLRSQHMQML